MGHLQDLCMGGIAEFVTMVFLHDSLLGLG